SAGPKMSKWVAATPGRHKTTVHQPDKYRPTNRHYSARNSSYTAFRSSIGMLGTFVVHLFKGRSKFGRWKVRPSTPRDSMQVRLRSTNSSRSRKDEDKRAPRLDSAHRTTPETMSFRLLRIDLPKSVCHTSSATNANAPSKPASASICESHMFQSTCYAPSASLAAYRTIPTGAQPRRQDLSPTDDTDHGDVAVEYESMVAGDQ
ncbi:hypothetical protein THAOC_09621, partial [Thalassiosira oceanica]